MDPSKNTKQYYFLQISWTKSLHPFESDPRGARGVEVERFINSAMGFVHLGLNTVLVAKAVQYHAPLLKTCLIREARFRCGGPNNVNVPRPQTEKPRHGSSRGLDA